MAGKPVFYSFRKHWKKSLLGLGLVSYGAHYAVDKYRDYMIRRELCARVIELGHENVDALQLPRRLHIILNGQACGGNASKLFEKNAAPLFHLAGIDVTVIKTDYEGHGKAIAGYIDPNTDGIIVAGGDGTLQEVVTGMFRENDERVRKIPVGIIPLGKENRFFNYSFFEEPRQVRQIGEATLAIIKGNIQTRNLFEISTGRRKSYALSSIYWGLFQEVKVKIDARKHWWAGPWKKQMAFITRTLKQWPFSVHGEIDIECYNPSLHTAGLSDSANLSLSVGKEVKRELYDTPELFNSQTVDTVALHVHSVSSGENKDRIVVEVWGPEISRTDFVIDGWNWLKANYWPIESQHRQSFLADLFKLTPAPNDLSFYHIDGEMFEAVPITVRLLRNTLNVFDSGKCSYVE